MSLKMSLIKCYLIRVIILALVVLTSACLTKSTQKHQKSPLIGQEAKTNQSELMTKPKHVPCWVNMAPERCEELKGDAQHYLFLRGSIMEDQRTEDVTERQKNKLKAILTGEFLDILGTEIRSIVFNSVKCQSVEGKVVCEKIYHQHIDSISKGWIHFEEIELKDFYWEKKDDNRWELYGLGKIPLSKYNESLENIRKGLDIELTAISAIQQHAKSKKALNELQEETEELEERHKEVSPIPTPIVWLEQESCDDINFQWKMFKEQTNINPAIEPKKGVQYPDILIAEVLNMYSSLNENGIYEDERVLETNSEIYKTGSSVLDEIRKFEEKTQKKMDKIVRCYEKRIADTNASFFEKEIRLMEDFNKSNTTLAQFNNYVTEWDNRTKGINQFKAEIDALKRIYKERLKLLSHTFLTFTYANAPRVDTNKQIMKEFFDALVEEQLKKDKVKHYIEKQISIRDNFANVVLEDSLKIGIQKASSDGISFRPITGRRAQIQKYHLTEATRSMKSDLKRANVNLPEDMQAKSHIIVGIDDVEVALYDGPNGYRCINCDTLNEKAYASLSKIAETAGINVIQVKEKIQRFINDVNIENARMVQLYIKLKRKFVEKSVEKTLQIEKHKMAISGKMGADGSGEDGIDEKIKKLFNIHSAEAILPCEVKDEEERDRIKKNKLKDLENRILYRIDSISKELLKHRRNKEIVLFSIIDKTEELEPEVLQKHVRNKFSDLAINGCPCLHVEKTIIKNYADVQREEAVYRTDPFLIAYDVPVFRIKTIGETDSSHYSIPIALKVICQTKREDFRYLRSTNEIIDINNNVRWEAVREKRIPKKRRNENSSFEEPEFEEYCDFCIAYREFLSSMAGSPLFQNWPRIRCLGHFEYDAENNIITDYINKEEWWIIDESSTFYNLNGKIRPLKWNIVSFESLEALFHKLTQEMEKGAQIEPIIRKLKGRYFWTTTRDGMKFSTIAHDGKTSHEKLKDRKQTAFGLVRRNL